MLLKSFVFSNIFRIFALLNNGMYEMPNGFYLLLLVSKMCSYHIRTLGAFLCV